MSTLYGRSYPLQVPEYPLREDFDVNLRYIFLITLILLVTVPAEVTYAASETGWDEITPAENGILNSDEIPSFFSYCNTDRKSMTGSFVKLMPFDNELGLSCYRLDIMPYSKELSNVVISERYSSTSSSDLIAVKMKNIYYKDDLIGMEYTSDDGKLVIKLKRYFQNRVKFLYYSNGEKDTLKSGDYRLFFDVERQKPQKKLYLDKYTDNIDIDLGLSAYAREYLGIGYDRPLTAKMLSEIKEISIFDYPLKTLIGIEYFTNLKRLTVSSGDIKDISGLAKLTKLEKIDISWCYINDLPDLSANKNLSELRLPMNNLKDISNIDKLTELQYIDLNSNKIEDISPVKGLKKLKMLSVIDNCILNFESLSDNKSVQKALEEGSQFKYSQCLELGKLTKSVIDNEIAPLINDGMSEIEKEKVVFDYVRDNMEYGQLGGTPLPYGYAALVNKKGVCGNYAELFTLLSRLIGLDATTVSSDTHEWNAIRTNNGAVYFIDTLWDDHDSDDGFYYFNRTGNIIRYMPEHSFDSARLIFRNEFPK